MAFGLLVGPASATNYFYQSGIQNGNWGNNALWSSGAAAPTNGFNIDIFIQGQDQSPDIQDNLNNNVDYFIDSITLDSGYFGSGNVTLAGGDLTLFNRIDNEESGRSLIFGNKVRVSTSATFTIDANLGDIDFNNSLDLLLNGVNVSVTGGETVTFSDGFETSMGGVSSATLTVGGGTLVEIGGSSSEITQVTVTSGTVRLTDTSGFGTATNVDLFSSGTFDLNGNTENIDVLTGSGSVLLGGATLIFGEGTDFEFTGTISESGGIIKNQNGVATLSGNNSYTGTTQIEDGTLRTGDNHRIPNESDVVIFSGATFDIDGHLETVQSVSGAGSIDLGSGGWLRTTQNGGSYEISGSISGSGEVRKEGTATMVLSGSNSFNLLSIGAGTVQVSSAGNLGSGMVTLESAVLETTATLTSARPIALTSGSSTIDVNAGTFTQTGVISGSGELNKFGNGTLVLSASNTYTGNTDINDGTVRLASSNRIGNASDVELITGATLDLNGFDDTVATLSGTGGVVDTGGTGGSLTVNAASGTFVYQGSFLGGGSLTKTGGHTLATTGGLSDDIDVVVNGGVWDLFNFGEIVDSISGGTGGTIDVGSATLTVDENSTLRTFSGVITGAGGFNKSGSHTLVLEGNNTFGGELSLSNGVLRVGSSNNLGADSTLVFFGGALNTTSSITNSRDVLIAPFFSGTIEVDNSTTLTQSGPVTAADTTTLSKTGGGTFALNSSNGDNFEGTINVLAGTLQFGSGDTVGNATDVSVGAAGTFHITQTEGIDALSGDSGASVLINNGQLLEVGLGNSSSTLNGVVSGAGGRFSKAGTGVLTLGGSNTYTGTTTVNAGTMRLAGSGRLSDATDVTVNTGATLDFNGVSDTIDSLAGAGDVTLGGGTLTVGANNGSATFTGDINESGGFIKIGSGTQTLSGVGNWNNGTQVLGGTLRVTGSLNTVLGSGSININGATVQTTTTQASFKGFTLGSSGGTVDVAAGTTLNLSSGTPINGVGSFTKAGDGILQLSTNNPYGGDTFINDGTIQHTFFASLPDTTDVVIAGGAIWDLNNIDDTVKSLSGQGIVRLGTGTLTVTQDGGSLTYTGNIAESGGFTKEGTHRLTLGGLNDYSGPTTINGGTLVITEDFHLGDPTNDLVFGGGTLEIASSSVDFNVARSVTLNAEGGTIFLEGGSFLTLPGVISGPGALNIESDNEDGIVLSGVNTYLGGTNVVEAIVLVSQNANLGANTGAVSLQNSLLSTSNTFANSHQIVLNGGTSGYSINSGATLTQAAPISGTGRLGVYGNGTLLLTEPATHAGDTFIASSATLEFGSGELPDTFNVEVSGEWDLNGVDDTIGGLDGEGTVFLDGATLTVGGGDSDGNFEGSIQGVGSLVKTGFGTQVLDGVNTHTLSTTIDRGTIELYNDGALGAASASLIFNEGVLRAGSTFSTGRDTFINFVGEFDVIAGRTLTFTSPIDGDANADLVKSGLGTLVLTQESTFGGLTEIQEGTLQLSGGGLLPSAAVDVFNGATLDSTDVSDTIGRLLGGGDVLLGTGQLTVGADDGSGTFGGLISGVGGSIVKTGTGTETFAGVNTYTGGTFLDEGVLRVSQSENLGALGTLINFNGGTLNTTASFGMIRAISLESLGGTVDVDDATVLDASGNITGLGALTKTGSGELALSGFSTYQGGTQILGGVVSIGDNNDLGNAGGSLLLDNGTLRTMNAFSMSRATTLGAGGGTFDIVTGGVLTQSGTIAGTGAFVKEGEGTLVLSGSNTFTGATTLVDGALVVDSSARLGDVSNTLRLVGGSLNATDSFTNSRLVFLGPGNPTIDVSAGETLVQSGVMHDIVPNTVVGSLTKSGGGTLELTAANVYGGPTTVTDGELLITGSGRLPDTTVLDVEMPAVTQFIGVNDAIDALLGDGDIELTSGSQLTVGSANGSGTFSGVISGDGSFVKVGDGLQGLRTKMIGEDEFPSTFSGGVAINGGVLDVEDDLNLGEVSGPLSFDNGTLQVQGEGGVNTTRIITLNAGGGTLSIVGDEASMDLGGVVTGPGSLTKIGTGSVRLSAANTYTGDTVIEGGLIQLNGAGRLPDASSVTVNPSSTTMLQQGLDLNDIDDAINGLSGTGDVDLGAATLTIGSAGAGGSFSGRISGNGGVIKAGAGTQVFSGLNSYMGGTAVDAGVLEIDADIRLGNAVGGLSFDGGVVRTTTSFSTARATTLNAGGGALEVADATILTHNAVISGVGALTKQGTGDLLLNAANTYTGPTSIAAGVLRLGSVERLSDMTAVDVATGATFDLDSFNESIGALSGAGDVSLGSAQLVVGLDDGSGSFSGVISGSGDLLKEGTGVQTLSGANTYDGATFVDRGELVLNGGGSISQATLVVGLNIGSDGAVTVSDSGTTWDLSGNLLVGFDGAGRLDVEQGAEVTSLGRIDIGDTNPLNPAVGTIALDGGLLDNTGGAGVFVNNGALIGDGEIVGDITNAATVAPGLSPGVLEVMGNYSQDTVGLLSIEIGGADNSDLSAPEHDLLDVSGIASLSGDLELALSGSFTPDPSDLFTILSASTLAGTFSNVADGARLDIVGGGTGSFQVNYTGTSVVLSDFMGSGGVLPGDANGDGSVDILDLDVLSGNFGTMGGATPATGDFNGDGNVDILDLDILSGNFGSMSAMAIPEPAAGILLAWGFAVLGPMLKHRV